LLSVYTVNDLVANGLTEHLQIPNKTNSVVWVRERTIPTERPPLVGEVSSNVCG
jgi:hypothetical protein